jgi:hypothetical protein
MDRSRGRYWQLCGTEADQPPHPPVNLLPVVPFLHARLVKPGDYRPLSTDDSLPRLVCYDASADAWPSAAAFANKVLHTHFDRHSPPSLRVSVELAVGFLGKPHTGTVVADETFQPCLVFLVRGDASALPPFLAAAFEPGAVLVSSLTAEESVARLPQYLAAAPAACRSLQFSQKPLPESWSHCGKDNNDEARAARLVRWLTRRFKQHRRDAVRSFRAVLSNARFSNDSVARAMVDTPHFACATDDFFGHLPTGITRSSMKLQRDFKRLAELDEQVRRFCRSHTHTSIITLDNQSACCSRKAVVCGGVFRGQAQVRLL